MRFLFLHDCAGVCTLLARELSRMGHRCRVVVNTDPFGIYAYYRRRGVDVAVVGAKGLNYYLVALRLAPKYDVIHVSSLDKLAVMAPALSRLNKRLVLHYHGTDIRGKWGERRYWRMADLILVSTPDLLDGAPASACYLPNPVDVELFRYVGGRRPGTALYLKLQYEDAAEAVRRARRLLPNVRVRVLERRIRYGDMPKVLSAYEYFIDRYTIPSLSKTALEALACECKVLRWDGRVALELPRQHEPRRVAQRYLELLGVG
ncbi:MAG: hypothetical protein DRJ56_06900 [Thermoprotei archaeon]|nr:MAG: hypothetical protein DRJ56_06900 [Thermoprotei archaeon]